MTRFLSSLRGASVAFALIASASQPAAQAVESASSQSVQDEQQELLQSFSWRPIGPVNTGGRVAVIAAVEDDPSNIYVGAATGGVWKTVNNGTTWEPVFDRAPCIGVGAIAIAPTDSDIVWVGTGEANNRQSTSYGCGAFKSTDGGKTWALMGLADSGHIGRIAIDPRDPNVVYVAAGGHLFKASEERGLYKTTDGGRTWAKSKFIDTDTGFTEVVVDPTDTRIVMAASYQRRRTSWGFSGSGPGSGLWKSTDAGGTWRRITAGLGETTNMGRIGLGVFRKDPSIIYALVEKGPVSGPSRPTADGPDPNRTGLWRSDDRGDTWRIASNFVGRPFYSNVVQVDPADARVVYLPGQGKAIDKSTDGGKTFAVLGQLPDRKAPYFGYRVIDSHALWIDPGNPKHLILGHDGGVQFSWDGGDTWQFQDTLPLGQFYEIGVDMRRPYYVYGGTQDNGSWGGPSHVRNSNGITRAHWFQLNVGPADGFGVQVDPTDWSRVYATVFTGNPFNVGNLWRYDLKTGKRTPIRPMGPAGSGDSDPVVTNIGVGSTAGTNNIVPEPPDNETYRFNWNPPLLISPHNPRVLYFGGNKLFRSLDRGNSWTETADLTRGIDRETLSIMGLPNSGPLYRKNDGVAWYGTLYSIAESPLVPGVLWVGTDDGNLQVSRDGGTTWLNVVDRVGGFDASYYIESIEASHFDAATAYVVFDGHRSGDFRPHLFKTTDYGQSWTKISSNLPEFGHINVVKEDPRNPRLLYVGTEMGFFISIDSGTHWVKFMNNLPATICDDLVVHPRDSDLVLGTHGRSVYILDDVTPLQQLTDEVLRGDAHLFKPRAGVLWNEDRAENNGGGLSIFRGENPPDGTFISYYLKTAAVAPISIQVVDVSGAVIRELTGSAEAGINRVVWDLRKTRSPAQLELAGRTEDRRLQAEHQLGAGDLVQPGDYGVKLTVNGTSLTTTVHVDADADLSRH